MSDCVNKVFLDGTAETVPESFDDYCLECLISLCFFLITEEECTGPAGDCQIIKERHRVVAEGDLAYQAMEQIRQGTRVYIEGSLHSTVCPGEGYAGTGPGQMISWIQANSIQITDEISADINEQNSYGEKGIAFSKDDFYRELFFGARELPEDTDDEYEHSTWDDSDREPDPCSAYMRDLFLESLGTGGTLLTDLERG